MPNFVQTCYIATDFNSKAPILTEAKTQSGKDIFSGKINWPDGKNAEGRKLYQTVKFHTFKREIFDRFVNNPKAAFDIKGYLKIQNKKDKNGEWQNRVEIQIVDAIEHIWEEKPIQHFQERAETGSDEEVSF